MFSVCARLLQAIIIIIIIIYQCRPVKYLHLGQLLDPDELFLIGSMEPLWPHKKFVKGTRSPQTLPKQTAEPSSLNESIFPLFIFNHGLQHNGAANH